MSAQDEIRELAAEWLNGNREHVLETLDVYMPLTAAYIAVGVFAALLDYDEQGNEATGFEIALANRVAEQIAMEE